MAIKYLSSVARRADYDVIFGLQVLARIHYSGNKTECSIEMVHGWWAYNANANSNSDYDANGVAE